MKKNVKIALIGSANLAVNAFAALLAAPPAQDATQPAGAADEIRDSKTAQINSVSLTSIEQTFFDLPKICKARNAAFDPMTVGTETVSNEVLSIHAALDAASGVVA